MELSYETTDKELKKAAKEMQNALLPPSSGIDVKKETLALVTKIRDELRQQQASNEALKELNSDETLTDVERGKRHANLTDKKLEELEIETAIRKKIREKGFDDAKVEILQR